MALNKVLSEELKEIQKKRRELKKREKDLKEHLKVEKDIKKWQKIMDVRAACNKVIRDANLGMSLTLSKLEKYPDYYVYQHPVLKKLKTSDINKDWVQKYLNNTDPRGGTGGVEADLIATAVKSRVSAWKRMNKKKKQVKKFLSGKGATGKGRASGTGIG